MYRCNPPFAAAAAAVCMNLLLATAQHGGGASVEILSEANLFIQTNCKCNSLLLVTAPIVINILNTATIVIGNIIVFSIIIISRLAIIIIIVVIIIIIIVIIIVIILQSRHSCSLSSPAG